jgi:hypothetical protein
LKAAEMHRSFVEFENSLRQQLRGQTCRGPSTRACALAQDDRIMKMYEK